MMPALHLAERRARILRPDEIAPETWDDLVRRAGPTHPFYSRHVIEAHRAAGLLPPDLRVLTVSSGGRLEVLLPFRLRRDLSALGGLVARPFLSPYVTATDPLVAAEADRQTLSALADGLLLASGGRAWRWPLLSTESEVGSKLLDAWGSAGWSHEAVFSFERPVLDRRETFEAFLAGHPHRARFKDLRRRMRRLGETGRLAVESATEGGRLAALVEAFMVLEKAGWKGVAGTALACRPETAAFGRALFRETGGPVSARADALMLDGRPIAISLAVVAGGTATLLKTAYDETLRCHAPGLLLEAEIARLCHEARFADRLDSATLPGSPLESLYRDRERIAEIIAVPPRPDALTLERRLRLARFERRGRDAAKRLLPSARKRTERGP